MSSHNKNQESSLNQNREKINGNVHSLGFNEESNVDEKAKLQLYQFREEHSVEIRESKRKQILKKNRELGSEGIQQEGSQEEIQIMGDFLDLKAIQIQTQEEYAVFRKHYLLYDRDDSSDNDKDQNVKALISALSSNCSPQFFIFASSELNMYFQDEDLRTNISIQDIYRFIDIILQTKFLDKASIILNDWRTALGLNQLHLQQPSFFSSMAAVNQNLSKSFLIGCLQILCGISRGSDEHCVIFQQYNFLQVFFDIFDATKTERDISEVMLFIIGNIAATRNVWRVFYMQRDFHNTIFAYLKYAQKNQENLLLHRRICWCLSNFTRDYMSVQQNKDSSQLNANGQLQTQEIDNQQFDFTHIKNLCDTFIQYQDPEIRTDISWTFSQLITIFFNETKNHPSLNGSFSKNNCAETMNFQGNPLQLQIYKQIVSEKIGFLIQNGICEYINNVFPMADMTILVPTLRIINKLMGGNADVLELFFSKCNDTIMQNITRHLQNQVQAVRREAVKTVHYMFLSDFEKAKDLWFVRFLPIILSRFNIEQYSTKEEIFKLLHQIIDKINIGHFELIVFSPNNMYCIFKTMRNSLKTYETKPEAVITIISLLHKIINYFKLGNSNLENQKVKRIIQLIEQNELHQLVEILQEHQLSGIYNLSIQFIENFNNIQENIIDEESRDPPIHLNQVPIQQDYIRTRSQQNRFENLDIEKCHEEQKI